MLNKIILFTIVMLSINICMVGLGIANEDTLLELGIVDATTCQDQAQQDNYATDSTGYVSVAPHSRESSCSLNSTLVFIYGLTTGYSAIFALLGLPTLITILLTLIISTIQIFCLFYMTAYFIGIFRGASI